MIQIDTGPPHRPPLPKSRPLGLVLLHGLNRSVELLHSAADLLARAPDVLVTRQLGLLAEGKLLALGLQRGHVPGHPVGGDGLGAARNNGPADGAQGPRRGAVDEHVDETVSALTNYGVHLRDARVRVEESIRRLEMELEGYGVGAQRGQAQAQEGRMREMARVYRAMEREIDEVKKDLKRLGR
ncbi:hypothetical protein BN1708_012224 [Verticillium longisporum]|uniref:Uncharacterized protein n=1 Tax=Verticillium longisporum TaxID=100787 RepID=A0A0G4L7Q7_VERLO|nr:hypothetical protein BN1708_012224 [Verticillium longisporum]